MFAHGNLIIVNLSNFFKNVKTFCKKSKIALKRGKFITNLPSYLLITLIFFLILIQRFLVACKTPAWSFILKSFRFALRLYTRSQNVNNHHEEIIPRLLKKYVYIESGRWGRRRSVLLHRWVEIMMMEK